MPNAHFLLDVLSNYNVDKSKAQMIYNTTQSALNKLNLTIDQINKYSIEELFNSFESMTLRQIYNKTNLDLTLLYLNHKTLNKEQLETINILILKKFISVMINHFQYNLENKKNGTIDEYIHTIKYNLEYSDNIFIEKLINYINNNKESLSPFIIFELVKNSIYFESKYNEELLRDLYDAQIFGEDIQYWEKFSLNVDDYFNDLISNTLFELMRNPNE